MFLRSMIFAAATTMMAAAAAPAMAETPDAACEATTFRVYFHDGATQLDPLALQTIEIAERNVATCGYAELRVTVDASHPLASERAEAIRTATAGRSWDVVRVEPRTMTQRVAMSGGPSYAEITMTPEPSPMRETQPGDIGV